MAEIDLSPGDQPLVLVRGDSAAFIVTLTEDDGVTPINLTGMTWRAQVRETVDGDTVLMSFDVDTTDAADGILILDLDADEWPAGATPLPTVKWAWDLEGTSGAHVKTYLAGSVGFAKAGDVSKA